jgi:hypothetical protein
VRSTTVGNRILYVEQLIPMGKPIHYPVQRSETADSEGIQSPHSLCNIQAPGIAADIIGQCLLTEFDLTEKQIRKLISGAQERYETSEELFQAIVSAPEIDAEKLRASILENLHTNCIEQGHHQPGEKCDDATIRNFVKSWKTRKGEK